MKKRPIKECFCALCRTPRKLRYNRFLSAINYVQILMVSFALAAIFYPLLGYKSFAFLPIVWAIFESVHKLLYRKDLKCPYCGFDPKWYKKDVKLARKKVEEFLQQNPDSPLLKRKNLEQEYIRNYQ